MRNIFIQENRNIGLYQACLPAIQSRGNNLNKYIEERIRRIKLKQNCSCAEQLYNKEKTVEVNRHELLTLILGGG